jgi:hypothetical protein
MLSSGPAILPCSRIKRLTGPRRLTYLKAMTSRLGLLAIVLVHLAGCVAPIAEIPAGATRVQVGQQPPAGPYEQTA